MTIAFKLSLDCRTDVPAETLDVQWVNGCVNMCHDDYTVTHRANSVNPKGVVRWRRISGRKISGQYLQILVEGFSAQMGSATVSDRAGSFFI